ncbi:glycerol kinase [Nannocystis exedens]|uniref:Glycerol kinase n=1 Tax=Nannocystis exedens TaxID=54 RepID=A0A1I2GE89_9BACT|nr:glycerol kinase GlpK [Nannocystis exedens]PCC69975.1 glycerol kinase [Nannocystis exedens]SFF16094.1 glycerol kinase [Nannocystis exedens]
MTTADLILAIDQGTTGSTCLLVDPQLRVLARATREFPQHFPQPGWVEHDPEELYASVLAAVAEVLQTSGVAPARIAAIGITNQRETSLLWDRSDGRPLHRALVWQDRRTADTCESLRAAGHEDLIRARTGLLLDPYFSATKLAWVLDHVPGARARAEAGELRAGTIDTYLVWRLTAGAAHVSEPSNASRTLLWPLKGGGWDEELCALLRVPAAILPRVLPCTARFGETCGVPGLPDGIPIHGIAGDQQAALFGQACFGPGEAKCTYGTGAFAVLNTGDTPVASRHGLLTTVGWQIGERTTYCLEGSAFMAGAVVQWLRDGLGFVLKASEIEALAASVPDSGGVVLVPAHAGLGAPYWRPHARGLISGITRGTTRAHIARAALEGIALQIADLLRAMSADIGAPLKALKVDGGAAANDLLMQLQADLLGVPIARPTMLEATALGAVFLAGLGAGIWSDTGALAAAWQQDRAFTPSPPTTALATLRSNWERAVALA